MNDQQAETQVREFLEGAKFRCQRPSKRELRSGKTPDFRVYRGESLCFFCEVKSLHGDDPLDSLLAGSDPGLASFSRNDPTFNRITAAVHTAVKQFDAVNADRTHPNVLALVDYDQMSGVADLLGIISGKFYSDDGTTDPIYEKYASGRMVEDGKKVDLYLWFDADREKPDHFVHSTGSEHHLSLCELFGQSATAMKSY
jgi:hypothetical protein